MHRKATEIGKALATGAAAGAAASIPMSWAMELMHRFLPPEERHALPPREITERMTRALGIRKHLDQEQRLWLSLAAHMGYGAGVGAIYAAIAAHVPGRPLLKGTTFGVMVWAGSYLGLLPAMGVMSPATQHPMRRNALMIVAHLVFGSALAVFTDSMEEEGEREHPQFLAAGKAPGRRQLAHS
jgi:uncharacterized membrane protein YagU involved in acid resistance